MTSPLPVLDYSPAKSHQPLIAAALIVVGWFVFGAGLLVYICEGALMHSDNPALAAGELAGGPLWMIIGPLLCILGLLMSIRASLHSTSQSGTSPIPRPS